ncbi:MAG: hypothetical protein K2X47_13245 [Bdellovibrionales bacterium]|nr:hypothetical protein [Bdellovibrionales bacterium]
MKQILFLGLGLAVVFLHQNCGKMTPANLKGADSSVGIVDPGTQSASQVTILNQVIDGYSQCERSGASGAQWTRCQRDVIEAAQLQELTPATAVSEGAQKAPFCYAFGPQCRQQQQEFSPAQLVQMCRANLVSSGFSDEMLTNLAKMDPVGYAVLLNTECLYKKYSCVIAVKCS